jgi:hypothetical protein
MKRTIPLAPLFSELPEPCLGLWGKVLMGVSLTKRFLIALLMLLVCPFFSLALYGETPRKSAGGVCGTIVRLDSRTRVLTIKTFEGRTVKLFISRECPVIKGLLQARIEDFSTGNEIFATTVNDSAEPLAARHLFSLDSALMMAAGNVSLYEYNGVISSLDIMKNTVEIKKTEGATREILIADYTRLEKDFRPTALTRFKTGDAVFCELRFRGLPKQTSLNMAALYLFDPLSYVCNKIAVTQGNVVVRGTITDIDPARKTISLGNSHIAHVTYSDATLWITGTSRTAAKEFKGRQIISFLGNNRNSAAQSTARTILDVQAKNEVLQAMASYRDIFRYGATSPIAMGKIMQAQPERNMLIVRNSWQQPCPVRISPGNTLCTWPQKPGPDQRITFEELENGDTILVEGYPPDQALRIIKL